ncbi:hypothetical protein KFL_006600020 [Klebsormidium nitens]|uniref:Uncharacterized protein n=1 Tax=Klebsormidium nitens TaxID=105231 RepID=A0A1Y1IPN7_KLENI|nr:hypothetical protein KFL_006600020 [Klebsormidium nitens]|eukprot:GAQ90597.1 hypothetical protein KFL_006600020 [Klebsormidium nitens]
MAATAGNLACKVAPLDPSQFQKAASQEARLIGVVQQPLCVQCRVRLFSGPAGPRQVSAQSKSTSVYVSKGADYTALFGKDSSSKRGVALRLGLQVRRGLRPRRSVRVQAEEPSDAEKEVQAKETLLRDALEEKSKKGEESKPEAGFKVENRQQVTAIVTGIISVVLAFGYLSLISLDSRGVNLIPPPPEALGE